MFQKFEHTKFPPNEKPLLVWDGACGFCTYWVTRWEQISEGKILFRPYQEVAGQFLDIPQKEFKKASRLITTEGTVHSGPDSAYMSYYIANKNSPWHRWYVHHKWFQGLSDFGYHFITKNRSHMFKVTKLMLGSNPRSLKPYWLLYFFGIILLIFVLLKFL
jgi:predicted DCC family thiol-disulfide oxidoreductase YuxK